MNTKYCTINPLLNVLYLYQYGLLIPILIRSESKIPIVIFTVLLVFICILTNGIKLSKPVFLLIYIPLLLILFKTLYSPVLIGEDNTGEILLSFLSIGISGILIGSISYNFERFLYYGTIIGWINFLFLFSVPFAGISEINYMRFGYAMLPTFCFTIYAFLIGKNKIINILIALFSGIEILLFGARGSFLAICIFFVIIFFFINKKHTFRGIIILFTIITILLLFYDSILYWVQELISSRGYFSYSLIKALRLVDGTGDIESVSSGRFSIYRKALDNIAENPILGSPLNNAIETANTPYYHNIVLDIVVSFGIIVFVCFFLLISISFIRMIKAHDTQLRWIYCILFVLSFGRLTVSSVFWQRPEFWLFISFFISNWKFFLQKNSVNIRPPTLSAQSKI